MAAAAILKIKKNHNISALEQPILTHFCTVMWLEPSASSANKNFANSKIQDSSSGHLKNQKLHYPDYGWTNFNKIGMVMCLRSSRLPQEIKFYAFKNSTWWPIAIWKIQKIRYLKSFAPMSITLNDQWILVCWCIIALPSLNAIKCTVIDNKTGKINDKNCSLSIVLTAMHQKLQKRWYYLASRCYLDDIVMGNIIFYNFCSFWCVVVNTMDKWQFLSFRPIS